MKVTFEIEDGEESVFETATFSIDINGKNVFGNLSEKANQFLYPFINGSNYSLKAMFHELVDNTGNVTDIAEALELDDWHVDELKELIEASEAAIERKLNKAAP